MLYFISYVVTGFWVVFLFLRSDISKLGKLRYDIKLRYILASVQALLWPIFVFMGIIVFLNSIVKSVLTKMIYHLILPDDRKKFVFSDNSNVLDHIYIEDGE